MIQIPPGDQNQEELYQLYHLYEISRAVNSSLDMRTVLQFIMDMTGELFKAEAGSIMLLNPDGYLTIEVAQGLSQDVIAATRVPLGEGIAGWVAREGEPLLLDGKVEDPRFKSVVNRKETIASSLCVPLKKKEKIIGVLMLRNPTSSPNFTESHLRFLSAIADQASIAVENARLYREEKERVEEMVRLNKAISYEKMKVEAIISNMADGLAVTSLEGEILLMNPAAERIFGIDRGSLIGRPYSVLFKGLQLDSLFQSAAGQGKMASKEISLKRPSEHFFMVMATPMRDIEGSVQGVIFLLHDITELKRITHMKTEFVSMVTHDLKTPLTSIQGFVEVILTRNPSPEKVGNYLQIVKEETARLVRLINNLLDLAKIEAGEFGLNTAPVNLTETVREALSAMAGRSTLHKFEFTPPSSVPLVHADRDLLIQVFNNLISNAIKYSPEGGKVEIRIRPLEQAIEVDVEDEGIGIPEEKLSRLFERFYRVDSKAMEGIKGTGLGLANVKYIVEAHGGSLRVKSKEGKGSVFTFSLPLGQERSANS